MTAQAYLYMYISCFMYSTCSMVKRQGRHAHLGLDQEVFYRLAVLLVP